MDALREFHHSQGEDLKVQDTMHLVVQPTSDSIAIGSRFADFLMVTCLTGDAKNDAARAYQTIRRR